MPVTVKTPSVGRSDTISYVTHITDLGQLLSRILRKSENIDTSNVTDRPVGMSQMSQIEQLRWSKCHGSTRWDDPNVTHWLVEMIQMSQTDQLRWPKCHGSTSWDEPNVTDRSVEYQMSQIDQLRWPKCHILNQIYTSNIETRDFADRCHLGLTSLWPQCHGPPKNHNVTFWPSRWHRFPVF